MKIKIIYFLENITIATCFKFLLLPSAIQGFCCCVLMLILKSEKVKILLNFKILKMAKNFRLLNKDSMSFNIDKI